MYRLERAYTWLDWGAHLVPKQPRSKHNIPGYGPSHKRIQDKAEADLWFRDRKANIGLILDRGFVCADFDEWGLYLAWSKRYHGLANTYTEKTARGAHVIFKATEELHHGSRAGVEFKTGGVVMVAPSVSAEGLVYTVLKDLAPMPLSKYQTSFLFPFLSHKLNAKPKPASDAPAVLPSTGSVVDRIKANLRIDEVIARAGVELWPSGPGELVGLCPFDHAGHKDTKPSLWVNVKRQRWGCYSPSCESNRGGEQAHDLINFVALVRHEPVRDAIHELAREIEK